MNPSHNEPSKPSSRWPWPAKISFFALLAIAAFFLISEHWAHLTGILPWFLILLCPLLHLFMHGGHGGHGHHDTQEDDDDTNQKN
jgi:Protein of unknown function (DUF2933)